MSESEVSNVWVVRGVMGFVGTTFVAVSLWLGSTVSDLAVKTERLSVASENHTKTSERLEDLIFQTAQRLNVVHEEQLRRTNNVAKVDLLEEHIKLLERRVQSLENR